LHHLPLEEFRHQRMAQVTSDVVVLNVLREDD
jgi:hypothetical protein